MLEQNSRRGTIGPDTSRAAPAVFSSFHQNMI